MPTPKAEIAINPKNEFKKWTNMKSKSSSAEMTSLKYEINWEEKLNLIGFLIWAFLILLLLTANWGRIRENLGLWPRKGTH